MTITTIKPVTESSGAAFFQRKVKKWSFRCVQPENQPRLRCHGLMVIHPAEVVVCGKLNAKVCVLAESNQNNQRE
jgi:hypothetical protein